MIRDDFTWILLQEDFWSQFSWIPLSVSWLAILMLFLAHCSVPPFGYFMAKLPATDEAITLLLILPLWWNLPIELYGWIIIQLEKGVLNFVLQKLAGQKPLISCTATGNRHWYDICVYTLFHL
ncbi:MAG: hypothetical protein ACLU4P_06290 [Ruminococcus sp.]